MTYTQASLAPGGVSYAAAGSGTATYIDENGAKKKGVVNAPADESGALGHWQEMARLYENMYRTQVDANDTAAAGATERTLASIRRQIEELNGQYQSTNRQLYRDYMTSRRTLPEELAAAGYTGGLAESSRVRLDTGYGEALSGNERARLTEMSRLRAQGLDAQLENEAAAREKNTAALREYYGYLAALSGDEYAGREAQARTMAAAGDYSGYRALGYSDEQIARLQNVWQAENPELDLAVKALSGAYTASQVAALPTATAQRYLNALGYKLTVTGVWDEATEAAFRKAFGRASGLSAGGGGYYGYASASSGSRKEKGTTIPGKGRRLSGGGTPAPVLERLV